MAIVILAVEDDLTIHKHVKRLTEYNGWTAIIASTAMEGLEIYQAPDFAADIILMDIATPGPIDGVECAEKIRELEKTTERHIPIVALTAHAYPEDKERCLNAGMDDYMSKPYTKQQFAEMIKKWCLSEQKNTAG